MPQSAKFQSPNSKSQINSNDSIINSIAHSASHSDKYMVEGTTGGFLHWEIGNWSLFGVCLPAPHSVGTGAGRQGIW
jgi:hypothetical protein